MEPIFLSWRQTATRPAVGLAGMRSTRTVKWLPRACINIELYSLAPATGDLTVAGYPTNCIARPRDRGARTAQLCTARPHRTRVWDSIGTQRTIRTSLPLGDPNVNQRCSCTVVPSRGRRFDIGGSTYRS